MASFLPCGHALLVRGRCEPSLSCCAAGGTPSAGRSRWLRGLGASAGFRATSGARLGERSPREAPRCVAVRGAVACVTVSVSRSDPPGASCSSRLSAPAASKVPTKFRAADGYVRSCMCCLPHSEVLLTFQTSPPSQSRRAAESLGRLHLPVDATLGPVRRCQHGGDTGSSVFWWRLLAPEAAPPHFCLVPSGVWGVARATSRLLGISDHPDGTEPSPWRSSHWVEAQVSRCLGSGS